MPDITIYHTPQIIDYMKTGWTQATLKRLLKDMKLKPRDILRVKNTPAIEMGLTEPGVTDAQILAAMVREPVLVERPIVVSPKGTRMARPVEKVLDLF